MCKVDGVRLLVKNIEQGWCEYDSASHHLRNQRKLSLNSTTTLIVLKTLVLTPAITGVQCIIDVLKPVKCISRW